MFASIINKINENKETELIIEDYEIPNINILIEALKINTTIKRLILNEVNLNDEDLEKILDSLKNNSLVELTVPSNNFKNVKPLCEFIKKCESLQILNLKSNDCIKNLDVLFDTLKDNNTLKCLYIDGIKIKNSNKLKEMIKYNNTLIELSFGDEEHYISDMINLCEVLKINTSLKYIKILEKFNIDKNKNFIGITKDNSLLINDVKQVNKKITIDYNYS